MTPDDDLQAVLDAMAAAWDDGCPVARPDERVARVVLRRWRSHLPKIAERCFAFHENRIPVEEPPEDVRYLESTFVATFSYGDATPLLLQEPPVSDPDEVAVFPTDGGVPLLHSLLVARP